MLALADNSTALVDEVDILLGAGQLSAATKASIRDRGRRDRRRLGQRGRMNRVYTAVLLTLAAPEYLVQK